MAIIGYASPIDLFEGAVPAGYLFVQNENEIYYNAKNTLYVVPKEIAESWTAVNSPIPVTLNLGSNGTDVIIDGFNVTISDTTFDVSLINISLASYTKDILLFGNYRPVAGTTFKAQTSIYFIKFTEISAYIDTFSIDDLMEISAESLRQTNLI